MAQTLKLGLPLAAAQFAYFGINTTDVILLGWLGADELAAAGLAWSLHFVFFVFGSGTVTAVAALCAQARGRRRHAVREVRRYVRQGFWVAFFIALASIAILWQIRAILIAVGQDPRLAAMAQEFLRPFVLGLVPVLLFMVLRNFVSAFGRARPVLVISIAGVIANALLNYGLIFGHFGLPAWGLGGAGIGSSLIALLMFLALLAHVLTDRRFRRFAILGHWWRPDRAKMAEILRVGVPIGGIMLLEVGLFGTAVQLMGWIGAAALAAHQVAIQCAAMAFMIPMGIGQAATVRVGLAAGRGDRDAVRRAGAVALVVGAVFVSAVGLVFWFLPRELVALFLDPAVPASAAATELAVVFLAIAAVFQLADSTQVIGAGALRGLKDTRVPMLMAAFGYWGIGFPVSLVLGFPVGMGGVGIWIGLAVGLAVVAAMLVVRFERRSRLQFIMRR